MAGRMLGQGAQRREGIIAGAAWKESSWEVKRGVKEWLSANYPKNRSYKPTVDQLELTRLIDLPTLRSAKVPCFDTLERALGFLWENWGRPAGVYPAPTRSAGARVDQ